MSRTSSSIDLLLTLSRDRPRSLAVQIEDQIRRGVQDGALTPGTRLPSSRDLAHQLAVSRGVVVNAYAQLASEGYLVVRQGSRPAVSQTTARAAMTESAPPHREARYDFRVGVPDVSLFPRAAWLRSVRAALGEMSTADLGYGDERGVPRLRSALSAYLGRVRRVVADPQHIVVTSGHLQGHGLVCRAIKASGARRIAFENPSYADPRTVARRAGLDVLPIGVDEAGLRVDELDNARVDAVVVTPAHQSPTGVVLAPDRRARLVAWLRKRDAIAIEDDYDSEYRFDRGPIGALQGLAPEHVVYAGSASKTLAPALRIGWFVVPGRLVDAVAQEKLLADRGTARIEQHTFADFLDRGELDRHLRRMRARYRQRRDALVTALADFVPEGVIRGIAAGLHAVVELPDDDDETAIRQEARDRGVLVETLGQYEFGDILRPPTLLLGYAALSQPTIRSGIAVLARAIGTTRR